MNQVKAWIDEHFKGDPIIWAIVILLSMFSILVVYSATGTPRVQSQRSEY